MSDSVKLEIKLNEHRERVSLYDIRWHNKASHMIGSFVLEGSEREAREYAAGKFSWPDVNCVRIIGKNSGFIYTFSRG